MINMLFNGVPANIMALAGLVFAFIMTCLLLVKCNDRLPKDQGREFAVNGALSAGKPRGAGFIFILVFIVSVVLFCELNTEIRISGRLFQSPLGRTQERASGFRHCGHGCHYIFEL